MVEEIQGKKLVESGKTNKDMGRDSVGYMEEWGLIFSNDRGGAEAK